MTRLAESTGPGLQAVATATRSCASYARFVDADLETEVRALARQLRGCRVMHVNATPTGGGVAEMLGSVVPLLGSLGLDVHWLTLPPNDAFFAVTKKLHN